MALYYLFSSLLHSSVLIADKKICHFDNITTFTFLVS